MGVVQTIKPRRSWSSSAPIGLAQGEIASNLTLKKIYIGTGSENIEFPDTSGIANMIAAAPFLPLGGGEISGNLTVGGNLIVDGDTITANVETMTVEDPIITLGGTTAPTVNDNKDRGVEFRWHNGMVAKVGFFGFDRSSQKFTFIPDAINTSEVFSGAKGTIVANLEGNASTATKVNEAVIFNDSGEGAYSSNGITFDGSVERKISYNTIGAAALAGSPDQDFSTNNLTVHGHLQIGSARLVYVPETEDLPAYLKLQHSDGTGTTVMHFVTSGGVTMYSAGMPSGGSIGGATVLLNGEPTESATFWAPTSAGSSGQYLVSSGTGAPIWADFPTTFAPSDHTHDDRYYTVTDINAKLANKTNWDTAYGWGNHASAGYAALEGSTSQNFKTKNLSVSGTLGVTGNTTLPGGLFDKSAKTITFSYGVGITSGALTLSGKEGMETPYIDFRQGVSGTALSRIISLKSGELSIFGKQVNGAEQSGGKIKLKSDTYAEKALYIGGASGAKLVYVAASGDTPAYLKLQNYDGGVMHFVTTGGQTMYSAGVPAGGGGGSATVILNGETNDNPTFWAPTDPGTTTGQYLKWNNTTGIPEWGTLPVATSEVAGIMKLGEAVATTEANGFMSKEDKKNLNLLYTNRLIYDAGFRSSLAAALTSIPSTFYKEGLLLKYADANEQHIYMYISTAAMDSTTKTQQGNWLRISKPDVDGGTY